METYPHEQFDILPPPDDDRGRGVVQRKLEEVIIAGKPLSVATTEIALPTIEDSAAKDMPTQLRDYNRLLLCAASRQSLILGSLQYWADMTIAVSLEDKLPLDDEGPLSNQEVQNLLPGHPQSAVTLVRLYSNLNVAHITETWEQLRQQDPAIEAAWAEAGQMRISAHGAIRNTISDNNLALSNLSSEEITQLAKELRIPARLLIFDPGLGGTKIAPPFEGAGRLVNTRAAYENTIGFAIGLLFKGMEPHNLSDALLQSAPMLARLSELTVEQMPFLSMETTGTLLFKTFMGRAREVAPLISLQQGQITGLPHLKPSGFKRGRCPVQNSLPVESASARQAIASSYISNFIRLASMPGGLLANGAEELYRMYEGYNQTC